MGPNDSFIFFNYRQDRAVQLTTAFRESDLRYFNYKKQGKLSEGVLLVVAFGGQIEGVKYQGTYREVVDIPGLTDRDIEGCITEDTYQEIVQLQSKVNNSVFVAMTEFYPGMNAMAAFPEGVIPQTIGEVISNAGLKQLRLAGPEKFAHVTGWFSGRRLEPFPGEDRHMAQDPTLKGRTQQGKSYDLVPEMTAYLEAQYALQMLAQDAYSSIIHNYQNLDMVGHTGNMEATISAVSHISACLQTTVPAFVKRGWGVIISADHGNADEMLLKKGDQMVDSTQHSRNPVPLWVLGADVRLRPRGIVPDTGSTVLDLMGLPRPAEMTAQSLIVR
jgi:2,3-bisphosphoglycerate-independent phosphoglycerate mutase